MARTGTDLTTVVPKCTCHKRTKRRRYVLAGNRKCSEELHFTGCPVITAAALRGVQILTSP